MSSENTSEMRNLQKHIDFGYYYARQLHRPTLPGNHGLLHCLRNDRLPYPSSGDDRLATFKRLFLEVPR